jgi:hypothetical protein
MFLNNYLPLPFVIVSVLFVGGMLTYTLYKIVFTGVHYINTNFITHLLIVISVVVKLGIFIYSIYNIYKASGPTTVHYDTTMVNEDGIFALIEISRLQPFLGVPANGYDITDQVLFNYLICSKSGYISITDLNGVFVNIIRVDNRFYTVDPTLIHFIFHWNKIGF